MNERVSSKDYWILLTDGTNAFDSGVRAGVMQIAREIGISRIRLVNEATLENIVRILEKSYVETAYHARFVSNYSLPEEGEETLRAAEESEEQE